MAQSKRRRIHGKMPVGEGLTKLEVLSMSGECMLTLNVSDCKLGRDLWKAILDKVPCEPGLQLAVFHNSRLALNKSLQQQGLGGQRAQVSATYMPVNLLAALRFAHGRNVEDEEFSLNGITEVAGVDEATSALLHNLPKSLRTLTFAHHFNQGLHHVRLPAGLQTVTVGENFNQSLDNVTWPAGLQSVTCDFWIRFQSEAGQSDMASMPSKFELWIRFQSDPEQNVMASRPSKLDFWIRFQSEAGQCEMASRPSKFDFWITFQPEAGQSDMASRPSKSDF